MASAKTTRAAACFALGLLAACASKPLEPSYDAYLGQWIGTSEEDLVVAFGIPTSSHVLTNGGRILEYLRRRNRDVVCTTRFAIDEAGRVDKWWFKGSDCEARGAL